MGAHNCLQLFYICFTVGPLAHNCLQLFYNCFTVVLQLVRWLIILYSWSAGSQLFTVGRFTVVGLQLVRWLTIVYSCFTVGPLAHNCLQLFTVVLQLVRWLTIVYSWPAGSQLF